MKGRGWIGLFLGGMLLASGCAARSGAASVEAAQAQPDGMLLTGQTTAQHGTLRMGREFKLHPDGSVTEVMSVEGTHKFADFWRERYAQLSDDTGGYVLSKEEEEGRLVVKGVKTFPSLADLNENSGAQIRLVDSLLFRSVNFQGATGSYEPEALMDMYGSDELATGQDWAEFLRRNVSFGVAVIDEVTGSEYRWDKTAREIGSGINVVIQRKQWRPGAYYGGAAIGALLIFVGYMGLFGRRHWDVNYE